MHLINDKSGLCDDGDQDYEYTSTTTSTMASTTTTEIVTASDNSCYRYHAGWDEFVGVVKRGFENALMNDIYSSSDYRNVW